MNHAPQQSSTQHSKVTKATPSTGMHAEIEIACIDLVCQLEHQLTVAKQGYRDDQVHESAATSERMLELLLDFAETHLKDDSEELRATVKTAFEKIKDHRDNVNSEPWTRSLIRVFFDSAGENSVATHTELGESMAQVCATVFVATIQRLGTDSSITKQVEQSMNLFVEEFTENW